MIRSPRGVCAVVLWGISLLAACDTKDARIGSMDPAAGEVGGSSGNDSIAAGGAGEETSVGGTGPIGSAGKAGAGSAGAAGLGASGSGAVTGGGRSGAGAGATAGGGAGAVTSAGSGATGDAGAPPLIADSTRLIAVSAVHACVVVSGQVYCWGSNFVGQTGAPPSDVGMPLVTVTGLDEDMAGVAVSSGHTCAWARSGRIYCWGASSAGQLGPDGQAAQYLPVQVPGITTAVEVAATDDRTCARLGDGTVRCWGDVAGSIAGWADSVTNATSITLAPAGACAITTAGTVSCSFALPANVTALQGARRVVLSSGAADVETGGFGCVIGTNDSVTCFGDDTYGQRGDGDASTSELDPAVTGGVSSLGLGYDDACALDSSGQLQCWGVNTYGAVAGYPLTSPNCADKTCERAPRRVLGLPTLAAVSAGWQTCGLATDGTVWCWGGTSPYAYSPGSPMRMAGPWETGACMTALRYLASGRDFGLESPCNTDADCVGVPLDLTCDHTCGVAGIGQEVDSVRATLTEMELESCAPAAAANCAAPAVSCPTLNERAVCYGGSCTYDDPARTGCTDRCACEAERYGNLLTGLPTDCDGFDLQAGGITCDACEGAGVYVVVANTGRSDFDGDVMIGFESPTVTDPPLPASQAVTLHLAFGEHSAPIHFASNAMGLANLLVSAAGDCNPDNDGPLYVTFPGPPQSCPSSP